MSLCCRVRAGFRLNVGPHRTHGFRITRGGFKHAQHIRPNRGSHKKGAPQERTWAENNHVITKYSVNVG